MMPRKRDCILLFCLLIAVVSLLVSDILQSLQFQKEVLLRFTYYTGTSSSTSSTSTSSAAAILNEDDGRTAVIDNNNVVNTTALVLSPSKAIRNDDGRTAVIYKTRTIEANATCEIQMLQAFLRNMTTPESPYDVFFMHEPGETPAPILFDMAEQLHPRFQIVPNTPTPDSWNITGSREKGKHSTFLWIQTMAETMGASWRLPNNSNRSLYENYWVIEEDIIFTGQWRHFLESADARLGQQTDLVADTTVVESTNRYNKRAAACRLNGVLCVNEHTQTLQKSYLPLFRISHRFAIHLATSWAMNGVMGGKDEEILVVACERWEVKLAGEKQQPRPCSHRPLFVGGSWFEVDANNATAVEERNKDKDRMMGVFQMGGWGFFKDRNSPANTIQGLAAWKVYNYKHGGKDATIESNTARFRKLFRQFNLKSRFPTDRDMPRNLIFHPVKCSADPALGDTALFFAGSTTTILEESTTLSTSDAQQKWTDFQQEIGRSVFYITGRFHRKPGTYQGEVDRLRNRIVESGMDPSRIFAYADTFPEFILKDHRWKRHLEFLTNKSLSSRGAGYWFWKAALLQHHMTHSMKDGDFVIYSDADASGKDADLTYMDDLLRTMIQKGFNLAVWRYRDYHGTRGEKCCPEKHWNKRDVYEYYCPGRNQTLDLTGQYHAAWFLLEKTPDTMEFIQQYLEGVSNFHFVSDEASDLANVPGYIDNRHDQSVFSLLLKCRYFEEGLEKFNGTSSPLHGKKNRIHMLSITSTTT